MSMVEVETALQQAYADGAFGLTTIYENQTATPPNAGTWAHVWLIPNQPEPRGLGRAGDDVATGIFQIDLNYPLNTGRKNVIAKSEAIRLYFYAGRKFTSGSSTVAIKSAGGSGGRRIDANYRVTMTISWEARISRS